MAEAAGNLNLGTLTVQLAADVSALRKEFNKAYAETQKLAKEANSLRASFDRAFGGVAHGATRVASNLNQIGESISKVFGEKGLVAAKQFASEVGVSSAEIEGISLALKGLSGAFSAVAVAAGAMSAPIAAALAMVVALIAAYGALKKAAPKQVATAKGRMEYAWAGTKDDVNGNNDALLELAAQRNPDLAEQLRAQKTGSGSSGGGIEIAGAFKDSMAAGLEDFKGIIDAVKTMFAPDQTKKDLEDKKKLADDANRAERERQKALQDAFAEQAKIYDEEVAAREADAAALKKAMEAEKKTREDAADAIAASIEAANAVWRENQQAIDDMVNNARFGGPSGPSRSGTTIKHTEEQLDALAESRRQGYGAGAGAKDLGNAALQGSGVGDYVAAFQKGGGIIGGIINVVLKLFEKSKGFKTILEMVNSVIQQLADGLGQIFDGLQPIVGVLGELVVWIIGILQPILSKVGKVLEPIAAVLSVAMTALEGLSPLLGFFANVIGGVLQAIGWILQKVIFPITKAINFVIMKIAQAVSWVINGIIDFISALIWEVGAVLQKFGAQDAGSALKEAANAMHQYEIDTKAINDAANDMWDVSYDDALQAAKDTVTPLGDLGGAAGDAAASMREFSDSLTNLPSGYKIALARYNAAAPLGGSAGGETNITINVNGGDAGETWKQIKKAMRRDGFLESGSSVATAPAFSAA